MNPENREGSLHIKKTLRNLEFKRRSQLSHLMEVYSGGYKFLFNSFIRDGSIYLSFQSHVAPEGRGDILKSLSAIPWPEATRVKNTEAAIRYLKNVGKEDLDLHLSLLEKTASESCAVISIANLTRIRGFVSNTEDLISEQFFVALSRINPSDFQTVLMQVVQVLSNHHNMVEDLSTLISSPERLHDLSGRITELRNARFREHAEKFPEKSLADVRADFETLDPFGVARPSSDELDIAFSIYQAVLNECAIYNQLTKDELLVKLYSLRKKETNQQDTIETLALLRCLFRESLGVYPYHTQMLTIILMLGEDISDNSKRTVFNQIPTGEGKSFVSLILALTEAMRGNKVKIVTSDHSLAARDRERFNDIITSFGFTSDVYDGDEGEFKSPEADIIFGTAYEFMSHHLSEIASPSPGIEELSEQVVIVDEADCLFIDELNTALIISSSGFSNQFWNRETYAFLLEITEDNAPPTTAEEWRRCVDLFKEKIGEPQKDSISEAEIILHLRSAFNLDQYEKGRNYVVIQGEVKIVDHGQTARVKNDSRYRHGLHELLELREGVPIQDESLSLRSMHHPTFFKMFKRLFCISGTMGSPHELDWLKTEYGLEGFSTPSYFKLERVDRPIELVRDQASLWEAIKEEIRSCQEHGQPILFIFNSVASSQAAFNDIKALIEESPVNDICLQLNNDSSFVRFDRNEEGDYQESQSSEPQIVEQAGLPFTITIATQVFGRGVDVKPSSEAKRRGGLKVISTILPVNTRVEYQIRGRAGRQGSKGESRVLVACDDTTLQSLLPSIYKVQGGKSGDLDCGFTSSRRGPDTNSLTDLIIDDGEEIPKIAGVNTSLNPSQSLVGLEGPPLLRDFLSRDQFNEAGYELMACIEAIASGSQPSEIASQSQSSAIATFVRSCRTIIQSIHYSSTLEVEEIFYEALAEYCRLIHRTRVSELLNREVDFLRKNSSQKSPDFAGYQLITRAHKRIEELEKVQSTWAHGVTSIRDQHLLSEILSDEQDEQATSGDGNKRELLKLVIRNLRAERDKAYTVSEAPDFRDVIREYYTSYLIRALRLDRRAVVDLKGLRKSLFVDLIQGKLEPLCREIVDRMS